VDTPEDPEAVIEQARDTAVKGILITHNHNDHLAGFDTVFGVHEVPIHIGTMDGESLDGKGVTEWIPEGDIKNVGELKIRTIHTPGHTPGSTCYAITTESGGNTLLLSGDTLFPGGPGRTRSPELFRQEIKSIIDRLFILPESTIVLPGHGSDTTIAEAKKEYRVFASKTHEDDLHGDVTWLGD
jgi:glyoxylase-like metal-dependent hydrolase (beta-lactamase superfamily II)